MPQDAWDKNTYNALHSFSPFAGSGGAGRFRGGEGVVRELEFLRPLTASILSERRAVPPFGILGGGPAAPGVNLWVRRDGRNVSLGGKASVEMQGGDRIRILTPGGGGYGPPDGDGDVNTAPTSSDGGGGAGSVGGDGRHRQRVEVALAAAVAGRGGETFSAPLRDGGSVAEYRRGQEGA